jgi:hypothetical protein
MQWWPKFGSQNIHKKERNQAKIYSHNQPYTYRSGKKRNAEKPTVTGRCDAVGRPTDTK